MSDASHVEKLGAGARAWNAWRREHPDVIPDLDDLDLPVGCLQFGHMQGGPIDLSEAELRRAALEHATLIAADLTAALLVEVDLSHARLREANLCGADLTGANLDHADLAHAHLAGAALHGARLRHSRNLTQTQIEPAHGDRSTTLPSHLVVPSHWLNNEAGRSSQLEKPNGQVRLGSNAAPHDVLGVSRSASLREIRAAYLRLVKALHPDAHVYDPLAEARLKAINCAYQDLKDLHRRAALPNARSGSFARRGAVFAAGFLTSVATVLAILGGLYSAGLLGPEAADPVSPLQSPAQATNVDRSAEPVTDPAIQAVADDAAWAVAEREGTSQSLHRYIGRFSAGRHASKANAHLPIVAMSEAALSATPDGRDEAASAEARALLRRYLDLYPNGQLAAEVRTKLAAIDAAEAMVRADEAAWIVAQSKGTREALLQYLDAYPKGLKHTEARAALLAIETADARDRAERAAWTSARGTGTKLALEQYLEAHPSGTHADQARQALAAIEAAEARRRADDTAWLLAAEAGTEEALRIYLTRYPDGSNAAVALRMLAASAAFDEERNRDDVAWAKAQQHNTRAAVSAYIAAHPNGRHVESARARLTSLRASEAKTPPLNGFKAAKQAAPTNAKADSPAALRWPSADEPFVSADGRIR
jgi:uncharacterized protein YjbI with pentapeptide repeats